MDLRRANLASGLHLKRALDHILNIARLFKFADEQE